MRKHPAVTLPIELLRTGSCFNQPELQELFFAYGEAKQAAAVAICRACPIKKQCREDARRNNEQGVWGGETDAERDGWDAKRQARNERRHVPTVTIEHSYTEADVPLHLVNVAGEGNQRVGVKGGLQLVTDEHVVWFQRLLADGWTVRRISRVFGFGSTTVQRNLRKAA